MNEDWDNKTSQGSSLHVMSCQYFANSCCSVIVVASDHKDVLLLNIKKSAVLQAIQ